MTTLTRSRASSAVASFLLLHSLTIFAQTSNGTPFVPPGFNDSSVVWSGETNGLRTGIGHEPDSAVRQIYILVLSSTNAGLDYVHAPSGKPPRLELRNASGVIIPPLTGRTDGNLPEVIASSDLPTHAGNGPGYYYFLVGTSPNGLTQFDIGDVFRIQSEGDYTLTALPVLYKFEKDGHHVHRVDLPSVTTKLHLVPSQ